MCSSVNLIEIAQNGTLNGKPVTEKEALIAMCLSFKNESSFSARFQSSVLELIYSKSKKGDGRYTPLYPFSEINSDKAGYFLSKNSDYINEALTFGKLMGFYFADNDGESHIEIIIDKYKSKNFYTEDFSITAFSHECLSWVYSGCEVENKINIWLKNSAGIVNEDTSRFILNFIHFIRKHI